MLLEGKNILILGVASERSIATAIADFAASQGAKIALTYQNDKVFSRVKAVADRCHADLVEHCDVTDDESVSALSESIIQKWGKLDGLVHSLAFAPQESISGDYLESVSRESFLKSHEISSYSLGQLCKALRQPLSDANGSVVTMSFIGARRAFPNYNVMGLAKASLEANVRYLAASMGESQVNVNAVSAGPIKTLAAAGIQGFRHMLSAHESLAPLKRNVTTEEVAQTVGFLLSSLATGITGEVLHVDGGFHASGFAS